MRYQHLRLYSSMGNNVDIWLSARQLHTYLGIEEDLEFWMSDIIADFELSVPINFVKQEVVDPGFELDYKISLEISIGIAMMSRSARGNTLLRFLSTYADVYRHFRQTPKAREKYKRDPQTILKMQDLIKLEKVVNYYLNFED